MGLLRICTLTWNFETKSILTGSRVIIYVDAVNGSDSNDGSEAAPLQTIAKSLSYVAEEKHLTSTTSPYTIYLQPGTYPNNIYTLDADVQVLGTTGNPEDVIIENSLNTGNWGSNYCIWTLKHENALLANMTMLNGRSNGYETPGALYITEAGGTASNCVFRSNSSSHPNGRAGAAWLQSSKARVTRCLFDSNLYTRDDNDTEWAAQYGNYSATSLRMLSGIVDNCIFMNCRSNAHPNIPLVGTVVVTGGTFVNNTIVENSGTLSGGILTAGNTQKLIANNAVLNNILREGTKEPDFAYALAYLDKGTNATWSNNAFDAEEVPDSCYSNLTEDAFRSYNPDALNLTPAANGMLIDTGSMDIPDAVKQIDFFGKLRLAGSIDVGAVEGPFASTILIVR